VTGKARFGVGDWDAQIGDWEVTSPINIIVLVWVTIKYSG
jgi:hypothetical protein